MSDLEKDVNKILKKLDLQDMLIIIKYIYSLEQENKELKDLLEKVPHNIIMLEDE